jgi:hypothetical protein
LTKKAPTLEKVMLEAMQGKESLEFNVGHVNMGKTKGTWKNEHVLEKNLLGFSQNEKTNLGPCKVVELGPLHGEISSKKGRRYGGDKIVENEAVVVSQPH